MPDLDASNTECHQLVYMTRNVIFVLNAATNDTFSVNISSDPEVSAAVGSNISLLCEATMDASISWFFNGLPIKVSMAIVSDI